MQFEQSIDILTSPERVFALYTDVENWGRWDPEVKSASIEGEFSSGVVGYLYPTSGRPTKAKFSIVDVIPNKSFAVESRLPFCLVRFDHELMPLSTGIRALHRVSFSGLLAPIFGRLIGGPIRKGLPATMSGLKRAAEQNVEVVAGY